MNVTIKSVLILRPVLLILLMAAGGCGSKTPKPTTDNESKVPPNRPLAEIRDPAEFASRLSLITNLHIVKSADYLANSAAVPNGNNALPPGAPNDMQIQAYPLMSAIWPSPIIETCWENPAQQYSSQMGQVRQAIAATWQASSKLQFTGWQPCPATSANGQQVIRIQIDDSSANNGPRTLGLGKQLAGVQHGMLLNFTFLHWGLNCQTMTSYCINAIAVHEFGHAIGLAHEQNRPDKPGECMAAPQGSDGDNTLLTPYDPQSVMNYCNQKYNNDGQLSDLDKRAVQQLYGAHQ